MTPHPVSEASNATTPRGPSIDDRRQVGCVALVAVAVFAGLVGMRLVSPPLASRVNVRWAEVPAQQRTELEQRFGLVAPQYLEGATWAYDLSDPSPAAVSALVQHPAVVDTHGIDRAAGVVAADTPRGITRIGPHPFGTWVDSEPVAWVTLGSAWAGFLSIVWLLLNRRNATRGTNRRIPGSIRSAG